MENGYANIYMTDNGAQYVPVDQDPVAQFFNKFRDMEDPGLHEAIAAETREELLRRKYGNQVDAAPLNDYDAWLEYSH